jgi:hypothetical protein
MRKSFHREQEPASDRPLSEPNVLLLGQVAAFQGQLGDGLEPGVGVQDFGDDDRAVGLLAVF